MLTDECLHALTGRYLVEWIFTLFAKTLPLEPTAWIWDQVLVLGDQLIFQCALGLLHLLEPKLLVMSEISDIAPVFRDLTASPVLFEALTAVSSGGLGEPTAKKRERWRPLYESVEAQAVSSELWASFLTSLSSFESSVGVADSSTTLAMRLRLSYSGGTAGETDTSPERNSARFEEEAMAKARARGRRGAVTLEWEASDAESVVDTEADTPAVVPPALSTVAADARRQLSMRTSSAKALALSSTAALASTAAASTSKVGVGSAGISAGRLTGRLAGRLSGAKRGQTERSTAQSNPEPALASELELTSAPEPEVDAGAVVGEAGDGSSRADEDAVVAVPEGVPPSERSIEPTAA